MFVNGNWYIGNSNDIEESLSILGLKIITRREEEWEYDYITRNFSHLNGEQVISVSEAEVAKENVQYPSDYPGERARRLQVKCKIVTTAVYYPCPITWNSGGYTRTPQPDSWRKCKNYLVITDQ